MEQKIALIANQRHGVVTRHQLLAARITPEEIRGRLGKGVLIREFPGVYRVGHRAPDTQATYLAAVRACGEGAVLSGVAAAWLFGLVKGDPPPPEVTCPTERRIEGITTRRSRRIHRLDVSTYRGIPITTVPRTLVDLAAILSPSDLARACHEAGVRYGTTPRQVKAVLRRSPRAKGAGRLRAVMTGDEKVTLSKVEAVFLRRLGENDLPLPEMNRPAGTKRVDARWPGRLTAEINGFRFHNSRHSWEQERLREKEARARGEEFRTFTYADVVEDPTYMLRELRALLGG